MHSCFGRHDATTASLSNGTSVNTGVQLILTNIGSPRVTEGRVVCHPGIKVLSAFYSACHGLSVVQPGHEDAGRVYVTQNTDPVNITKVSGISHIFSVSIQLKESEGFAAGMGLGTSDAS